MFDLTKPITELHIELTDKCNALCPQCTRTNTNNMSPHKGIGFQELKLGDFEKNLSPDFISKVQQFTICGTHGDPLAAKDCQEIIKYLQKHSKSAEITIHTNGSYRTKKWWESLSKIENCTVIFGIDGIDEKTHKLYRVGINLNKVLENARYFIDSGGSAVWQMILFQHNEHQLQEARVMAKNLGFKKFMPIKSTRFLPFHESSNTYTYKGKTVKLKPASSNDNRYTVQEQFGKNLDIQCYHRLRNDVYISSTGHVVHCCHIGGALYRYELGLTLKRDLCDLFQKIPTDKLNLKNYSIDFITTQEDLLQELEEAWKSNSPSICKYKCSALKDNKVIAQ